MLKLNTHYKYAWINIVLWYRYYRVKIHHQYHGIISIPKSPFISVCQSITVSSHTSDRRLFRLAKVSWYHRYNQIVVYFSLPSITAFISYHQVPQIDVFIGLTNYHGSSVIPAYQSIIASLSRLNELKSILAH